MTTWSGRLIDYLGQGTAASRPASVDLAPGAAGFYFAYDTVALSVWNSNTSAWDSIGGSGSGTVTSVGLSLPADFSVSGSPITTTGTLTAAWANQSSNVVFAGPASGSAAAPTWRALVNADLPSSGATSGSYTNANITVNAQGIVTAASNGSGSGMINPMTTAGDLIVGGSAGTPVRFAAPTTGTTWYLTYVVGTGQVWSTSSASVAWGGITGTLSDQTDLQTALDAKAGLASANVFTAQQAVTPYRANISGTVSIDLAATAKSNNLHLTLTGNVTSFALTNPVDGAVYNIRFIQDSTGSRTITLPSAFKFAGGTAPTFSTAANAVDFMSAEYGSTEGTYMAAFQKGMA